MSKCYPIVQSLVNEIDRSKALIKYETKQLQVQLKRISAWDKSTFQYAAEEKPPVMWLDAIFNQR